VPWPSKLAALHLRADEKGTTAPASQPAGAGQAAAMARRVALGAGSAAASAPSAASTWPSAPGSRITSATARSPAVIVPVLSKHSTSTRARISTAGSSCTSTCRRPSRTTPTANATLTSSTSPSGTMWTVPATAPRRASLRPWERSWLATSRIAVGTSSQVTNVTMRSTPARSSERARVKRRASSASWAAYASRPTLVAR
jgi:hypothetical protein